MKKKAPSDQEAAKAWKKIMAIAEAHALICQAYSGTATLAMPDEQRKAGIRENVLQMGCFEPENKRSLPESR